MKKNFNMKTFFTLLCAVVLVGAAFLFINFMGYVLDIPGGLFN